MEARLLLAGNASEKGADRDGPTGEVVGKKPGLAYLNKSPGESEWSASRLPSICSLTKFLRATLD